MRLREEAPTDFERRMLDEKPRPPHHHSTSPSQSIVKLMLGQPPPRSYPDRPGLSFSSVDCFFEPSIWKEFDLEVTRFAFSPLLLQSPSSTRNNPLTPRLFMSSGATLQLFLTLMMGLPFGVHVARDRFFAGPQSPRESKGAHTL